MFLGFLIFASGVGALKTNQQSVSNFLPSQTTCVSLENQYNNHFTLWIQQAQIDLSLAEEDIKALDKISSFFKRPTKVPFNDTRSDFSCFCNYHDHKATTQQKLITPAELTDYCGRLDDIKH
jgi:hypothetical protein